jgi:hypothetical protein
VNFTIFGIPFHICQDEIQQIALIGPFLAGTIAILIRRFKKKRQCSGK